MSKATVGVMLNLYKRPEYMGEQIAAVRAQTHPAAKMWCWCQPGGKSGRRVVNVDRLFQPSDNTGVWSRFYAALEMGTDFVLILDDDTIPGPGWIENCLETYERTQAPLGAIGIIYGGPNPTDTRGRPWSHREGWDSGNTAPMMVDHLGHAWFMPMEMLRLYAGTKPCPITHLAGEDYHLSWAVQRHLGIRPWVPPHPQDNPDIWGSTKGVQYGCDEAALFTTPGQKDRLAAVHAWYSECGWRTMHDEASRSLMT